jgi:hypothetical protein
MVPQLLHTIYFVILNSRLLQPISIQQLFIFQNLTRQPIGHNIPIVHHNRAGK